jgi:hypothetical protein
MNSVNRVLAISGSLEGVRRMIEEYYGGSSISLIGNEPNTYSVLNRNGQIKGVRVILKNRRYRFEKIMNYEL